MSDKEAKAHLRETKFGHMTVGQVMEASVQSCDKETQADMAASYMMEGFGSIPIVDDTNRLVGIVSEFDLLDTLRKGKELNAVTVGEIMSQHPVSATKNMDLPTVIEVLQNNHLIRLPVVDSAGKLIGIVARRDILRGYLQSSG